MNLQVDFHLKGKFTKCLFRPKEVNGSKPKLMFLTFTFINFLVQTLQCTETQICFAHENIN